MKKQNKKVLEAVILTLKLIAGILKILSILASLINKF